MRLANVAFAHFDTAAALYNVTAHSVVIPARLSFEFGIHVKKVPLSFTPFFAFPTLFTPGDVHPHVHPKVYAGGLRHRHLVSALGLPGDPRCCDGLHSFSRLRSWRFARGSDKVFGAE